MTRRTLALLPLFAFTSGRESGGTGDAPAADLSRTADGAGAPADLGGEAGVDLATTDSLPNRDAPAAGRALGEACTDGAECADGTCLPYPGGYCTRTGCDVRGCPAGGRCMTLGGQTACFKMCTETRECRAAEGYTCDNDHTCYPPPPRPADLGVRG